MGEVYRATDSNLKRSVAIKVLPASVAGDADRLARFRREAEVLATLNHPNIAAIYGLEKTPDCTALVMELVEGDDLSQRITRGAVPIDEALAIAKQIAEALEAAHEQGIIHRDLKPANIKVRSDGTVKVLDFGLAKAMEPPAGSSPDISMSPTITTPAMTQAGMILGTAAYMSPEQAKGRTVDKRSDVWAFGAVLYEMLTGRRAFDGEDVADTLARILMKEPDWTVLPAALPRGAATVLRRCLQKDRRQRIRDIGDVSLALEGAFETAVAHSLASGSRRWTQVLAWSMAAVALLSAGALMWRNADRGQVTPLYASIDVPPNTVLGEDDMLVHLPTRTPMAFTPDGRSLIVQVARDGKPQLVLRSLDRPDARPIAGTDDARVPFVSPDGKWIGFSTVSEIRKVPFEGGTPTAICTVSGSLGPIGATWGARDVILFGDPGGRIMRVSAGGGAPVPVTAAPAARHQHATPFFLPDGVRFLFSDVSFLDARDTRLMIQSIDGGDAQVVLPSATDGRVLLPGRLVFMRLGTLMTTAFNAVSGKVVGAPVAALDHVMQSGLRRRASANNTGAGMFAVSSRGDLAVVRGDVTGGEESPMIWLTQDGRARSAEPTSGAPAGGRLSSRISPDGTRAAVTIITPTRFELWIADWKRNVWTQCTGCRGDFLSPFVWSSDGRSVLLSDMDTLIAHTLDESAPDHVLVQESDRRLTPRAWLADGRIVYESRASAPINVLAPAVETKLLDSGARVGRVIAPPGGRDAEVSRDGRWLAYTSLQSGQLNAVVVQAFPVPAARTSVSAASGGSNAVWSIDGRRLYYLTQDTGEVTVHAVDITTNGGVLNAGTPRDLFRLRESICGGRCYDVSDGPQFLFRGTGRTGEGVTRMDLILNWTTTLPKNQ